MTTDMYYEYAERIARDWLGDIDLSYILEDDEIAFMLDDGQITDEDISQIMTIIERMEFTP